MSARRDIPERGLGRAVGELSLVVKSFEPQRPLSLGSATYLLNEPVWASVSSSVKWESHVPHVVKIK